MSRTGGKEALTLLKDLGEVLSLTQTGRALPMGSDQQQSDGPDISTQACCVTGLMLCDSCFVVFVICFVR